MRRSKITRGLVPFDAASAPTRPTVAPVEDGDRDWCRFENIVTNGKKTSAEVFIYDEIGYWGTSAASFVKELKALDVGAIDLHLNSPGGEVFDGVTIYNALKSHKAKVTVYVDGLAASAASFIAQSGDEVVMGRASTMMIHDAAGMAWGNAEEMRGTADILDKLSDSIADIYAQRTNQPLDTWRAFMKQEVWYNAQEAVNAGLADSIQGDGDAAENKWNLSVFNHAGRSDAPSPVQVWETITNRVKENAVANTNEAEVPPVEETEEVPPVEETEEVPPVEEAEEAAPVTNQAAGFMLVINGVQTSDPRVIQAHIDGLQQFQQETRSSAREAFIDSLATDGKIGGPAVEGFKNLAKTLTDEQYELWTAPWDAAPKLPLLGKHTGGVTNTDAADAADQADRIVVLRGIVDHHKQGGMSDAVLSTKASYIELQQLTSPTQS